MLGQKERIEFLMKRLNATQQQFAEVTHISAATLSNLLHNKARFTHNHVEGIRGVFPDINIHWLMYGEGDPFPAEKTVTVTEPTLFESPQETASTPVQQPAVAPTPQVVHEIIYRDKPPRQITEIRIFFDDGTFETYGCNSRN